MCNTIKFIQERVQTFCGGGGGGGGEGFDSISLAISRAEGEGVLAYLHNYFSRAEEGSDLPPPPPLNPPLMTGLDRIMTNQL